MTRTGFLRFMTCGSVDDGKSTLIGRMLYDAGLICEDQLSRLVAEDGEPDCSRLLDGLLAEREQGITIDVAYRHFATSKRRFMVADSPGHEEYTANMVTAASHADLAVLLVDASKGFLLQTRRHAAIARLMGIGSVLLAVNKMDLINYSENRFHEMDAQFQVLSAELGIAETMCIPVCARDGENVVRRGKNMRWYTGPTLLDRLETVEPVFVEKALPFRMAVQYVNRPDSSFRGIAGTIAAGRIHRGDRITVLDTGISTRVECIRNANGEAEEAAAGEPVTLTFTDEIDASRGCILAADAAPAPHIADRVNADLIWFSRQPLQVGRDYIFKRGPVERHVTVTSIRGKLNLHGFREEKTAALHANELGKAELELLPPLPFESYDDNRIMGHGILINRVTGNTVGAALLRRPTHGKRNVTWQGFSVSPKARGRLMGHPPCALWFTGLSGAGKSTIADMVERRLYAKGRHTFVLDGDNVRHGLNRDLGFSDEDRVENIRRVGEVAKLMTDAGLMVLVALISPFAAERRMVRSLFPKGRFFEIFVDTPLATCMSRDAKGLYKRALNGELKDMTSLSSPYERPEHPDLILNGGTETPEKLAEDVIQLLEQHGYMK